MTAPETGVTDCTRDLLERPTVGQVRFSDVYPEVAGLDEPLWWRLTDFDGALTDRVESSGFAGVEQIPIGLRPWMAPYGLLLADDLVAARNERVDALVAEGGVLLDYHPDVQKEVEERAGAVVVLGNKAPRDNTNTENGQNGSNFYLAITDSGTELYVTPAAFLGDLEAQDRITALYEIPNTGHPEFNGDAEQFRSARVNRTRRHPDHLVRVFDYEGDREALRQAKADDTHPKIIPIEEREGKIAHVDKYGNSVIWLKDRSALSSAREGEKVVVSIRDLESGGAINLQAVVAANLKSAPLGELAVYGNCSTPEDGESSAGLTELIARVDEDPNTSENTAFFQLRERVSGMIPNLLTAEISLQEA